MAAETLHLAAAYLYVHAEEYGLNCSRMALMGGSAGSMAGFYALAKYPSDFKAFINLWGVPEHLPDTSEFPPVLSVHGDCDELVPFERELALQAVLEENNIEHRLIVIKNSGHTPVRQRSDYLPEIINFIINT